jgi:hypothetical protein
MNKKIIFGNIGSILITLLIVSSATAINITNNGERKEYIAEEKNCNIINTNSKDIGDLLINLNANNTTTYSGKINGSAFSNSSLVAFPFYFFQNGNEIVALWVGIAFIVGWTASGDNIDFIIDGEHITYEHEGFMILFLGGCSYYLLAGNIGIQGWSPYISINKI